MNPRLPHTYANRILIVVSGLSPQVVTETIYALTQENKSRPFVPTRVIVVTTGDGAQTAEKALFEPADQFRKLCKEYRLTGMRFAPMDIRCARDSEGRVDADAHDEASLNRMGDLLLKTMCEFAQPDSALHVSIAGGRKSMSYLAGTVLALMGRRQDRLSHVVLGDARLERNPFFFFPLKNKKPLKHTNPRTGKTVTVPHADATIRLADVPFLRLAEILPKPLIDLERPSALTTLIAEAQKALTEPERGVVKIDTYTRTIKCNNRLVPFPLIEFALYYSLARRSAHGMHLRASDEECLDYLEHLSHVTPEGAALRHQGRYPDNAQRLFEQWFWTEHNNKKPLWQHDLKESDQKDRLAQRSTKFGPNRTNVNKRLRNSLGAVGCRPFQITVQSGLYALPDDLDIQWVDERPCKAT